MIDAFDDVNDKLDYFNNLLNLILSDQLGSPWVTRDIRKEIRSLLRESNKA